MGTIAEPSLRHFVQETRALLFNEEPGAVFAEMEDLLKDAGIVLHEDLDFDEYIQTLYHLEAVLDGKELDEKYGFGAIGKLAGDAVRSLRRGFKMVFGRMVKTGGGSADTPAAKTQRKRKRPAAAASRQRKNTGGSKGGGKGRHKVSFMARDKKRQTAAQRQRAGHRTASSSQRATASGSFTSRN